MIVVSTTTAPYKCAGDPRHSLSWLANAEAVQESVEEEVRHYAAVEVDGRGLGPYEAFLGRLGEVGGVYDTFSYDDGSEVRTTANRLVRICMGQNLGSHYGAVNAASHVLFCATDVILPDDALPRLLELDWPITGLNISTYCLGHDAPQAAFAAHVGPTPDHRPFLGLPEQGGPWDVRTHMQSAALLLVRRDIFTRLRWRIDPDRGMTDDPCYWADARDLLGWETLVRHDIQAGHYPETISAMENRHPLEHRKITR